MWRISGRVLCGQAITRVGLQKYLPQIPGVQSTPVNLSIPVAGGYRALIDTGAQMTCITKRAILENGIRRIGRRDIAGVDGPSTHGLYSFHIGFECESVANTGAATTYFQWEEPQFAVDIPDNGNFDVIIGMNILSVGDLHFNRDGTFSFSFG